MGAALLIRSWLRSSALLVSVLLGLTAPSLGAVAERYRITGPLVHDNLAIYLVHGRSQPGPVPIGLQEALDKKLAVVSELGRVNQLAVENLGDRELFIQSGDIVTGGKQDRVFVSSLVLPPHSGRLTLAVFCVEPGRWVPRLGTEDGRFVSASSAIPSPAARAVLSEAAAAPSPVDVPSGPNLQMRMWADAAAVQTALARHLHSSAADPRSPTSLALSLDGERLRAAEKSFVDALGPIGLRDDDVLGFVLAVNGRVSKAEIYASNALFRAMWIKQLRAAAAEAIETESADKVPPPSLESIARLLDVSAFGPAKETPLIASVTEMRREGPQTLFVETRHQDATWVLRSYLATPAR